MDQNGEIGEKLLDILTSFFHQPVEIHLHPWWNSADECHILVKGLFHYFIELGFPIFNTIRFERRQLIAAQVTGNMMVDDAAQTACWNTTDAFQFRGTR